MAKGTGTANDDESASSDDIHISLKDKAIVGLSIRIRD